MTCRPKNRSYTGIGSRQTPVKFASYMGEIARRLDARGFVLRSGGADGADLFFEAGATSKEIFLPWRGFNDNASPLCDQSEQAFEIAAQFHPAWDRLKPAVRKLMARNVHQVLGRNLDSPSSFVVCWTPGGRDVGGTAQAIRIARHHGIPVGNLALREDRVKIEKFLEMGA